MQASPPQISRRDPLGHEAGAPIGQDQLQTEPADVGGACRTLELRIDLAVLGVEGRPPVDVNIVVIDPHHGVLAPVQLRVPLSPHQNCRLRVRGHQNQGLVEQVVHPQTRPLLGAIHQCQVHGAGDHPAHQVVLEADLGIQRHVRGQVAHPRGPPRQELIPEGDPGTDGQTGAKAARQAHVVPRLLIGQHQRLGVTQKAPPRRCQDRPGPIANEKPCPQRLLQALDARADRGLGDMHPVGGFEETAVGGHLEKGLDLFDVHGQGFYTRHRRISVNPSPGGWRERQSISCLV